MSKESKKYKNVALMSDSEKMVKTLEGVIVKQRTEIRMLKEQLTLAEVSNWVAVEDQLPDNDNQVFVKYKNGMYGVNEWWESDNCWKYQFDNMIVKEWCKPPCS